MADLNNVLNNLDENGKIKFPQCTECKLTEKELFERDGGKTFLVMVEEQFVCGSCAIKILTPRQCQCGVLYKGNPKFCKECGVKL